MSSGVSQPRVPVAPPALRARGAIGPTAGVRLTQPTAVRPAVAALVLAAVVGLGACFALLSGARPSYDAMGWMVWGHQALHWNLNTDGAPSWKPLAFLFTLPYALAGHQGQLWLWTLTASAGALGAGVLAGRIAFLLTPAVAGRGWARWVAAAIAGVGVLGMNDYLHQALIANSDPLTIALLLGAIERHLADRPGVAYGLIWLAGLDRPESWVFLVCYGAWCWWARPQLRRLVLAGLVLTPLCWFVVPALTSHSWLSPSRFAMGSSRAIHGSKLVGVINRLRGLLAVPVQIALAAGIVVALRLRDRALLWLLAAVVLWGAVELAFALHGFSAAGRYLLEPGAVAVVLLGAAAGRVLGVPRRAPRRGRVLGPLAVLALLAASVPSAIVALRADRRAIAHQRLNALQLSRLTALVAADGGARAIRSCGQPVSLVGFQSALAWELDMNVGAVGFHPGRAIDSGKPIVFFKPHGRGWIVHADHPRPGTGGRCRRLDRRTAFG